MPLLNEDTNIIDRSFVSVSSQRYLHQQDFQHLVGRSCLVEIQSMLSLVQSTRHGISAIVSVSHYSHVLAENCLNFSCIISFLWSSSISLWIVWAILGPENHINFNLKNTDRVLLSNFLTSVGVEQRPDLVAAQSYQDQDSRFGFAGHDSFPIFSFFELYLSNGFSWI